MPQPGASRVTHASWNKLPAGCLAEPGHLVRLVGPVGAAQGHGAREEGDSCNPLMHCCLLSRAGGPGGRTGAA